MLLLPEQYSKNLENLFTYVLNNLVWRNMLTNTRTQKKPQTFPIFQQKRHEQNNTQEILTIVSTSVLIHVIYFIILRACRTE